MRGRGDEQPFRQDGRINRMGRMVERDDRKWTRMDANWEGARGERMNGGGQ